MINLKVQQKIDPILLFLLLLAFSPMADSLSSLLITPGYGISGYFQLMPGKVKNNLQTHHSVPNHHINKVSVSILGSSLVLATDDIIGEANIRMMATSGKLIMAFKLKNAGHNKIVIPISPNLPTGAYIICLENKMSSNSAKFLFVNRR
jgi:hypothetical protein